MAIKSWEEVDPPPVLTRWVGLRMPLEERRAVEACGAKQPDKLSLSRAIRRLVQLGLAADVRTR
jgi:hypothetical protein